MLAIYGWLFLTLAALAWPGLAFGYELQPLWAGWPLAMLGAWMVTQAVMRRENTLIAVTPWAAVVAGVVLRLGIALSPQLQTIMGLLVDARSASLPWPLAANLAPPTAHWLGVIADCVTLALLPTFLRGQGQSTSWVWLYALNPVTLYLGMGAQAPLLISGPLILCVLWLTDEEVGLAMLGSLLLGLTICVVPQWLPLALLTFRPGHQKLYRLAIMPAMLCEMLAYLRHVQGPLSFWGSTILHTWNSLNVLHQLVYFAAIIALWLLLQSTPRKAAGVILLIGWVLFPNNLASQAALLPLALMLCPWRPGWLWVGAAGALGIINPWLAAAVGAAWLIDIAFGRTSPQPPRSAPTSLDIVIPTLNESAAIGPALDSIAIAVNALRTARGDLAPTVHVMVVDGGSTDDTVARVRTHTLGASLRTAKHAGRGNQLAVGIAATTGDLVVMLHADATLHPDALTNLVNALDLAPATTWGVLGLQFDSDSPRARWLAWHGRLRLRLTGLAFGDQGIFVRRDVLSGIDGFPALPLMEDVEVSLRLAHLPGRLQLRSQLTISTRRWSRQSVAAYLGSIGRTVFLYLLRRRLGSDPESLAYAAYERYYGLPAAAADSDSAPTSQRSSTRARKRSGPRDR